jgi:hypothetical protein
VDAVASRVSLSFPDWTNQWTDEVLAKTAPQVVGTGFDPEWPV